MKKLTSAVRDVIAPEDTAIWERAVTEKRIDETLGHTKEVPFFDPRILRHEEVGGLEVLHDTHTGQIDGTCHRFETSMAFGDTRHDDDIDPRYIMEFASKLYLPSSEPRHPFFIDIDTPIGTGIEGLNSEVAERLMKELNVPVLLKGPEFSGSKDCSISSLVSTALAAVNISQSFTAEMSMVITEAIAEQYDLPENVFVYGKSRGAMLGGKKHSYAQSRDLNILGYRLIDPCIGKRAFESAGDTIRYGIWIPTDMARSVPSFVRFALEGKLRSRTKTIETDAHHLVAMLAGTVPSLLSGEEMGWRIALDKGISLLHMQDNQIADTPQYLKQFANHRNFDSHRRRDAHMGGIVLPRNIRRSLRFFTDFGTEYDRAGYQESQIDWIKVHNNPQKQSDHTLAA